MYVETYIVLKKKLRARSKGSIKHYKVLETKKIWYSCIGINTIIANILIFMFFKKMKLYRYSAVAGVTLSHDYHFFFNIKYI